jgi:DNA-binding GntR family transcriptional regulator
MNARPEQARRPGVIIPRLVVDDVYSQLLSLIVDGHVAAEQPLGIDSLAREFGVSSSPVREALARLESTGLVRRVALRGYRVAPVLSAEEFSELMEARLVIEPVAAGAASTVPSAEFLRDLRESIDDLERAPKGDHFDSFRDYLEADHAFHRLIFENAGNRFLELAYAALGGHLQRFRLFSGRGVTDAPETIHEHALVFEAISSGSPGEASVEMRRHIEAVGQRALEDLRALDHVEPAKKE